MDNRKKFCVDIGGLFWAVVFVMLLVGGGCLLDLVAMWRHG